MPFLQPNQQRQSTEGTLVVNKLTTKKHKGNELRSHAFLKHINEQGYDAAGFAEIHDLVDEVIDLEHRHQCVTHAAMIRQMQLRQKRGDAAGTQLHVETSITDTRHTTLHDLCRRTNETSSVQQSIDSSWPPGPQQQTHHMLLQQSIDETDRQTDRELVVRTVEASG